MTSRNDEIVRAARTMFTRYGYGKTTMADIASEAGVARQTVYNAFPGKAEILRAVVQLVGEETLEAVVQAWAGAETVDEKLAAFQLHGPVSWFEAIEAAPDAAELLEGVHTEAAEVLKAKDARWISMLIDMLTEAGVRQTANDMPLSDIVEFFYSSSVNAKYGVEDVEQLKRRLAVTRAATLALLGRD